MSETSDAHLNAKLCTENWENLNFWAQNSFLKYLRKANRDLLRKCAYKIC